MKRLITTLITLCVAVQITAAQSVPEWLKDGVIYHIYPSSFKDSNGDGVGDIEGIRSKLDYVKSVGATAIWLSPIFKSEFEDGGYDITDFYMVDPRFGTNSELVNLVREAHAKGIKVCLDLVAGHTSDKHPWFVQSKSGDTNLQYSDYFIWSQSKGDLPTKKFVKSDGERDGNYLKNFFDIQPALNYGYANPDPSKPWQQPYDAPGPTAVRNEIKRIMAFWMDKGVDGFRCDMAPSLVKDDDEHHTANCRLWGELRSWMQNKYPQNILISEWSNPQEAIKAGFHIDLIIHNGVGNQIYRPLVCNTTDKGAAVDCYFDRAGKGSLSEFVKAYSREYYSTRDRGIATMPTSSHDVWRLNRMQRSEPEDLKVALTLFTTMPWVPIIYYGEEIGIRNQESAPYKEGSHTSRNRSSCRTPMQWSDDVNAGFSTADPTAIYLPIDPDPKRATVAAEQDDPNSMLNYVRGILSLRAKTPALSTRGDWQLLSRVEQPYPMVYMREADGERYIVALNPSGKSVECSFDAQGDKFSTLYGNDAGRKSRAAVAKGKATLKMKPVSAVVMKIE